MIVKKMPILQGFPDFETVKFLSISALKTPDFRPVFYDIETTGLSRNSTFLYLIGAAVYEENSWQLFQWMASDESEEKELLCAFSEFLKNYTCTIQYNGDRFDQPYLEARYALYGLSSPFEELESMDLYQRLKICQPLLKLPRMKQADLEVLLKVPPRLFSDGKECIRQYLTYTKTQDSHLKDILLGHNLEDVLGLGYLLPLLTLTALYEGNYTPSHAQLRDDHLMAVLLLPAALPFPVSNGNENFYISVSEKEARLLIPTVNGRLKQYYSNYKDYVYLPGEDTALPKALATGLSREQKRPARPETCYTWFSCTEGFLSSPEQQMHYFSHSLPQLLKTLKKM